MKYFLLFFFLFFGLLKVVFAQSEKLYLGFMPPKQAVIVFAPALVSTQYHERDLAISPDQKEIYYTIASIGHATQTIACIKQKEGAWSAPEIVPFSGTHKDIEPVFSPDGKRLYFSSNRPLNDQDKSPDYNIWYVVRQGETWSAPMSVGEVINTDEDEFYPSIAKNGSLYFTAAYKNAKGKEDIYCAKWLNNVYQTPESLSDSVNQAGYEFNAFVAPDESYILFTGYGRADDLGGGDLYIATKNAKGEWTKARNLGDKINSKKIDYCPYVSADGKYLFFTSERFRSDFTRPQKTYQDWLQNMQSPQNGLGDIYWVEMSVIAPQPPKGEK